MIESSEEAPEISDLIVSYDPVTLARLPVSKEEVIARFRSAGNEQAARVVEALPEHGGILDPLAVDRLLVRVHIEMQRLSEEFQHGGRVALLLAPLLRAIRQLGAPRPLRVVDVGCGSGYVVRALAAHGGLGDDVELVGADFNAALLAEARRLAALEGLDARFVQADALGLAEPATVVLSTGVIHHFRGAELDAFLARHDRAGTLAFVHFDFQPSIVAPFGSWIFHKLRFREPLALHDGVLSAARAHTGEALITAARRSAKGFVSGMYSRKLGPFPRVFHTLLGVRRELEAPLRRELGGRSSLLEELA